MRRRLLASTLAVAVVAVVLLGLPLGVVGARLIHDEARQRLADNAQRVAAGVEDRLERKEAVTPARLARLAPSDLRVRLVDPSGHQTVAGPSFDEPVLSARIGLPGGGEVQVATTRRDIDRRVMSGWLLVAGLVVLSTAVAVGLAVVQARRLGEPLDELAVTAGRLGSGDTRGHSRRYGVPEIDRVAQVLDRSAERLGELLSRQRDFVTDASHQLRTPLTALSIRLEEISITDDLVAIREECDAALAQVERLASVVDVLLSRARSRDSQAVPTQPVNVAALLRDQLREWEPAYRRVDRTLVQDTPSAAWAVATPGGLAQVVASLLDNALVHGAGQVTISARQSGEHIVIEVTDEGSGVGEEIAPHVFERSVSGGSSTGLGLSLARALVESDGGRLELLRMRPPVFAVFLAAAVPAAVG